MTTQEHLDKFHHFASQQIADGPSALSLEEMVEQWRIEQQTPEVQAADVAAIREALDDMKAGDTGEPAEEALRQLRNEFGLDPVRTHGSRRMNEC